MNFIRLMHVVLVFAGFVFVLLLAIARMLRTLMQMFHDNDD